jgi:NADH-ubiquinone oxidoreductase chain 1
VLDLIFFIIFLLIAICILVGVAFIVVLERRVLGYVHIREGSNRVGFIGLFQPFSDAIKLFTREQYFPLVSNYFSYYLRKVVLFPSSSEGTPTLLGPLERAKLNHSETRCFFSV